MAILLQLVWKLSSQAVAGIYNVMNSTQKQILAYSAVIDEQSGGQVKITYHKTGAIIRWNVYENGEKIGQFDTAGAMAFVLAWRLAVQYSPLPLTQ